MTKIPIRLDRDFSFAKFTVCCFISHWGVLYWIYKEGFHEYCENHDSQSTHRVPAGK